MFLTGFSGTSVDNIDKAKEFYGNTLGLKLEDQMGGVAALLPDGTQLWFYPKADHQPATYTTFNFIVSNIDEAVDALTENGVIFEHYEGSYQDEKGIARGKEHNMGPNIAWFKDPAGNILGLIED